MYVHVCARFVLYFRKKQLQEHHVIDEVIAGI